MNYGADTMLADCHTDCWPATPRAIPYPPDRLCPIPFAPR